MTLNGWFQVTVCLDCIHCPCLHSRSRGTSCSLVFSPSSLSQSPVASGWGPRAAEQFRRKPAAAVKAREKAMLKSQRRGHLRKFGEGTGEKYGARVGCKEQDSALRDPPSVSPSPLPAARENDGKVRRGEECVPHSQPWQVALFERGRFNCGASLISPYWVLSAAHCQTRYEGRAQGPEGSQREGSRDLRILDSEEETAGAQGRGGAGWSSRCLQDCGHLGS